MANFEYYLEMFSNNKRMLYRNAYEAAYRDLMAEYNEEVRVQDLMAKMAVNDRKANAQIQKALMGDNPSFSELTTFIGTYNTREMNSEKAQAKSESELIKSYTYPQGIATLVGQIILDAEEAKDFHSKWRNDIQAEYNSLTPRQQAQFAVDFSEAISSKYTNFDRDLVMEEYFKKPKELTRQSLQAQQEKEIQRARKDAQIPASALERKQYKRALATFPELSGYEQAMEGEAAGKKESIFETAKVKPPTEKDILARAADYYAPTGSRKFQKSMEELAAEREAKKIADKKAKQEIVDSMPSWGGQALKVAPRVEELSGKDDNELLESDDTGIQLGIQTHRSQQFEDIGDAISYINSQAKDDAQKSSALSAYLSRQYRQYRTTQEDSLENLLGDE